MSRASRRYHRTLLLSVVAMGALVWVAMDQFDVSRSEIFDLATSAVVAVGIAIAGAAIVTITWVSLKAVLQRLTHRSGERGADED